MRKCISHNSMHILTFAYFPMRENKRILPLISISFYILHGGVNKIIYQISEHINIKLTRNTYIFIRYNKNHSIVICCKTRLILHHAFMTGCTHEYEEQLFVTTRQNDVGVRLNLFCKQNPDVIYR